MDATMTQMLNDVLKEVKALPKIKRPLAAFAESFQDSQAGAGEAVNMPDVEDRLEAYFMDLINMLCLHTGCDEETAQECLSDAIKEAIDVEMLPALPDAEDLAGTGAWLAAAQQIQLGGFVLHYCLTNYDFDDEGGE